MKLNVKRFTMGLLFAGVNIIPAPSALDIVNVVAMAKGIKADPSAAAAPAAAAKAAVVDTIPLTAPYLPGTNYILTPALGGAAVSSFIYSPNFADGSYTELFILPTNLALIPTGISVVFIGNVGRTSTTAAGCYDAVVSAYPAGSTATTAPIFSQVFESIVKYTGDAAADVTTVQVSDTDKWTSTDIVYNGAVSTITGYGVEISTAAPGSAAAKAAQVAAVTPAPYPSVVYGSPVTLPTRTTISSFNFFPFIGGDAKSMLSVSPANLGLIPANTSVIFTLSLFNNTSGGYDAVVSAYAPGTATPIFSQGYPSIVVYSGTTPTATVFSNVYEWNDTTFSYTLSNGTTIISNPLDLNPGSSTLSTNTVKAVSFTAAAAVSAVALPTNIYSSVVPIAAGNTISSFDFSPNFSDNTVSQMMVSPDNITLMNKHLSQISNQDVLFGLTLTNNSSGWSGSVTAFDVSEAVIFTQPFPSLMSYSGFAATATPISAKATHTSNIVAYTFAPANRAPINYSTTPASAFIGTNIGLSNGFGFSPLSPAPYPKVVYGSPVTLPTRTTILSFNFFPVIGSDDQSMLSVSPANLGLIPANTSVIFTLSVVNNVSGGYDAVISAYAPGAATPIFSQEFLSIVAYSGTTPTATVFSNVYEWSDTTFSYTLSNGTTTISKPVDLNPGSSTLSTNTVKAVSFTAAAA
jgi:hypothetical protein